MSSLCSVHMKHKDFILCALIWSEAEVTLFSVKSYKCHYVYNNVRTSRQDHNCARFEVLMTENIKSAVLENRTMCNLVASCQWSEKYVKFTFRVDRWRNLIIIWLDLKYALLTSLIGGGGTSSSVISVSNGVSWTFGSSPAPPSATDSTWTASLCRRGALWWINSCKINSNSLS